MNFVSRWVVRAAAVCACLAVPIARGQQGVGVVVVADPLVQPLSPTCGVTGTYSLQAAGANLYDVIAYPEGTPTRIGGLLVTASVPVASDLPAAINNATGSCDWSIALGTYASATGEGSGSVGLVISEVAVSEPDGPTRTLVTATFVPTAVAAADMLAIQSGAGVTVNDDEEQGGSALGSSCSCPNCPLGGRIWVPFFVIGIGQRPGGTQCCRTACDSACAKLHSSGSESEAWTVGQGMWVTCMICQ